MRPPVPEDVATTGIRIRRTRADLFPTKRPKVRAYVAVGTNLGDRREHLRYAVKQLPGVLRTSGVYETAPVGGPEQGPYLNMVVEIETAMREAAEDAAEESADALTDEQLVVVPRRFAALA